MIVNYVLCILAGVMLGFLTGLTPGVHINLVAVVFVSFAAFLSQFLSPIELGIILFVTAVTHNIADNIPAMFLGIPNTENMTELLPVHQMVKQGRARDVMRFGILGMLAAIVAVSLMMPPLLYFLKGIYEYITKFIPYILLGAMAFLIVREKQKWVALIVVSAAGILGIVVFSMKGLDQPLLPMLSGLFGVSALLASYGDKVTRKVQVRNRVFEVKKKELLLSSASAFGASLATSFLPGLSTSHTSLLASSFLEKKSEELLIFLTNFCNTMALFLSLVALVAIEKARSGIVVALANIVEVDIMKVIFFMACSIVATVFIVILCLKGNEFFVGVMQRVAYKPLCIGILCFLVLLVFFVTGWLGLLVLMCAVPLGMFTNKVDVSKNNLMSCIMLPVALYLLV